MTNPFLAPAPKFRYGKIFGAIFFTTIGLLLFSSVKLVNDGRIILTAAKEQRALMNKQQRLTDDVLFTATQIQDMMTSGLLSTDRSFKTSQKERYGEAMELNSHWLDSLGMLQTGSTQENAFKRMMDARNANTLVRERIIDLCLVGSRDAITLFNSEQRQLNEQWLNSISDYGMIVRSENSSILSRLQNDADRLIIKVALSYLATGILLILLAIQVYVSGKRTAKLSSTHAVIDQALNSAMLVNRVSTTGQITSANENLCQLTGYTQQELIGESTRIFNSGYHDKAFFKNLWDTIQAGNVWHDIIRNKGKNGKLVWMNTVIVPLKDQHNDILEYLVFRTDITDAIDLRTEKIMLEQRNFDVTSSIEYASRITNAVLPSLKLLKTQDLDHFVLFRPYDILSGDFMWWKKKEDLLAIAAVDCTGHGVPGALMSLVATQLLDETFDKEDWNEPGKALGVLNNKLIELLEISTDKMEVVDGMDMAICILDKAEGKMYAALAYRDLFYTDADGNLQELRGDPYSIGGGTSGHDKYYNTHIIDIEQGMTFYMGSDGYQSQFGGPDDKKFGKRQLRELFRKIKDQPFEMQQATLAQTLDTWQGDNPQTDDIMLLGIKVG